ncbi:MAG: single-stranded DNA-binding protein, partial [Ignavibacteria bacterium]|nr:single-stranded DNA-binding protein [Ignavibacteria bacterium]
EIRYSNSGLAVLSFTLATNQPFKDTDGNWKENTTWHDIVCFGNLAERFKDTLKKGKRVYVEGKISKRSYTDKSQTKRWVTEINADNIILLERGIDEAEKIESEKVEDDSAAGRDQIKDELTEQPPISEEDLPF